jgi:hypothetical protein
MWALNVMKRSIHIFTLVLLTTPAWACEEIEGLYHSVSETHWNFVLELTGSNAILTYTDYSSGVGDTRTDYRTISQGHCAKENSGHFLTFAERTISIEHHPDLTHSSYGAKGSSPGITGGFIKGQLVHLWLSQ